MCLFAEDLLCLFVYLLFSMKKMSESTKSAGRRPGLWFQERWPCGLLQRQRAVGRGDFQSPFHFSGPVRF